LRLGSGKYRHLSGLAAVAYRSNARGKVPPEAHHISTLPRRNTVTDGFPGVREREQSFARRLAPHALKKQARRQGAITKI
jgi:hypothetical protein